MDDPADALHDYYALGHEHDRLAGTGRGVLEFERTKEILLRRLPAAPAVVADVGGGPGRYALWLAGRGYRVEHRDLVALHVDQLRAGAGGSLIGTAVGDARELDLGDGTVDAVLLLGPIYHLRQRRDRLRALGEAWRVVRPGGPVFVAAISRWAPRLDGELLQRLYGSQPEVRELVGEVERTGWMRPLFPGSFSAFCHRPGQLRAELGAAGLEMVDLVTVEGMAFALSDLDQRMDDPLDRAVVLEAARALERVPELLGVGPHLLATAVRPAAGTRRAAAAPSGRPGRPRGGRPR
jgi:SAM-dependent methyltransferase